MSKDTTKGRLLQESSYTLLRTLALPFFRWRFRISADSQPQVEFPYVVVANHVTELDFVFLAQVFSKPMGFVVGQGLLKNKLLAYLLIKVLGCVPKRKGSADVRTALGMMQRLRQGRSICLFAEGNTTFDGRTGDISPVTGSLLKALKSGLITCRIQGGYFSLPRWGRGIRRGRTNCKVVGVYSPQQLQVMSSQQINALLKSDLYTDAYEEQQINPIAFLGKNTASGLEYALYLCPGCNTIGSLTGTGDVVGCSDCGLQTRYTAYGSFENQRPFSGINTWVDWQRNHLKGLILQSGKEKLLEDAEIAFEEQAEDGTFTTKFEGELWLTNTALGMGNLIIPLEDLKGLEIFRKNTLQFTTSSGKHYQTVPKPGFNALKYRDAYHILTQERSN